VGFETVRPHLIEESVDRYGEFVQRRAATECHTSAVSAKQDEPWYAVRCFFRVPPSETQGQGQMFEERITLWRSDGFDAAIALAEREATEYAETLGFEYIEFAQCYHLATSRTIRNGDEVFSLMRQSDLVPAKYLKRFFDTGSENDHADPPPGADDPANRSD
jgi:hypothetical protein